MKKRILAFLMTMLLIGGIGTTALAHEVPDLNQNGTITLQVNWDQEPVDGGLFQLYRVGDVVENDGNYGFSLVPELSSETVDFTDLNDITLAKKIGTLAQETLTAAKTALLEEGVAAFSDVEPGLYVVVQTEAAVGFSVMSPFFLSMPRFEDGVYVTEIVANPKVPLETAPQTEPETEAQDPELPQTGQLNWPIPVMAAAGIGLFLVGWALYFGRKSGSYEE